MTTQPIQSEKELQEEYTHWYVQQKNSDPDMPTTFDVADYWLAKMKQNQRTLLTSLIEEVGLDNEYVYDRDSEACQRVEESCEHYETSGEAEAGGENNEKHRFRTSLTAKLKALDNE